MSSEESLSTSTLPPKPQKRDHNDQLQKVVFGIDLGTTHARAAIVKRNKEDKVLNHFIEAGDVTVLKAIPSVVTFLKDGKCLAGKAAKKRTIASASNTWCATKRLSGRRYDDPIVLEAMKHVGYEIFRSPDGYSCRLLSTNKKQILTPAQIEALILMKLKELCEEKLKEPMENVVLTVPAYFNSDQIEITKEAGRMAGLNVLDVVNTPSAAALAYFLTGETFDENKTVVVYDFGGHTFNVSVVKLNKGASNPEVLSTVEDLFLGGENFDKLLVDHFVSELKRKTGVDSTLNKSNKSMMQHLKQSAENVKINLTISAEANVYFWALRYLSRKIGVERITLKVTRSEFEDLIAELINKTIDLCQKALKEAKISIVDVDEILAVGGTSKIPKVREAVKEFFNKEHFLHEEMYREDAAAIGAALRGQLSRHLISSYDLKPPEDILSISKPATQSEKFIYSISDVDTEDELVSVDCIKAGLMGILTDEEADEIILARRTRENSMDDGDVNYIMANAKFNQKKRRVEKPIPQDLADSIDFFRKGRDQFVEEELSRVFSTK